MDSTTAVALVLSAGAVGAWGSALTARGRARAADRFARRVDLALEPGVAPHVTRRLAARDTASAVGLLAGVWIAAAALALASPGDPGGTGASAVRVLVLAVGGFVGQAVAAAALAWAEVARRPAAAGPRVARATSPAHADYVHPVERRGAEGAAVVSALVAVAVVVADRAGLLTVPVPWPLVAMCLVGPGVALAADELVARRLLDRGQRASSPLELAWDDALRARTLRDLATVPVVLGAWAPLVLLAAVGDRLTGGWPGNPAVGAVAGATAALILAWVVLAVVSLAVAPARHFRRRLWPAPVAGGAA